MTIPGGLLYDPTKAAVPQLLGILAQNPAAGQPGQPAPAPVAPMQPQAPQNLLGKVHDFIQNHLAGSAPAEYAQTGLLSPQDLQAAKPGIFDVIAHQDAYRKNLDRVLQAKQIAQQVAEQKRLQDVRANMQSMFKQGDNEDHPATMARLEKMFAYAVQNGDMDTADRLKGVIAEMAIPAKSTAEPPPHTIATKTGIMQWDPSLKKFVPTGFQAPDRAEPTPQIIAAATPNADGTPGTPTYFRVPKDNGPATPIAGITPNPGSKSQNAQNMAAEALLRSSVSEMTNADKFMQSYEQDLASGKKSINGLAQFMGGIGNSFTHDDPASRAIQNTALTALNKINPDLARYIRRGLSFAEGEAGISKRPSDFRTKMAAFLSTAASGASPDMITDIQGRRASILNPLHQVLEEHPTGGGGGKPRLTQAQYDAGRKKGHSDAEIASHYDLSGISRK